MVRGGIYLFDPSPRSGSELKGLRPCILVSHSLYASSWKSVTVVPLSTSARWLEPSSVRVQFEVGECGLQRRCAALPHQITTADRGKLKGPPIGHLTPGKQAELDEAIRNYLSL